VSSSTVEAMPRPSTPPSSAASIPLPPSPTVGSSPTKHPMFSKDRDLERLRKATATANVSPKKDTIFQQGDEAEPNSKTALTFEYSKPAPSTLRSTSMTPDDDSELDGPSRIDPGIDVSRTSMSFDTPPRSRRSIRHKRNQFQTPPPEDLPDLPPRPESPIHVRSTPAAKGEGRTGSLDKEFSFPPGPVSESLDLKTPTPPGAWNNDTVVFHDSRTPSPDTPARRDPQRMPFAGVQTPAPPGSWATPTSDDRSVPEVHDDNAQLDGQPSTMRTPAPPGAWSSASTAPSANNSLKKGILKVRFDETSVASWNELQRIAGDEDASELGNSFALGHEKVRKPLPGRFHSTSEAQGAQGPSSASSSKAGHQNEQNAQSPGGSARKRKSRLRMVDEFGNALEEQPAMEDGEEDDEMPQTESLLHDDDLPATSEEIRGLRRVARTVPQIARDFAEERRVLCLS
jgi:hypothetical protein